MIIGMRGHDFGRMEPSALAEKIASHGYHATQLAFGKAFPKSPETYMTDQALLDIRKAFETQQIQIPVMGCYVSASDRDDDVRNPAKKKFCDALRASVILGAGCVWIAIMSVKQYKQMKEAERIYNEEVARQYAEEERLAAERKALEEEYPDDGEYYEEEAEEEAEE